MTWLLNWLFSYSQYITYKPVIFFVCAIVSYMSFSNKVKQQKEEKYYWNNPSLPSCGRRSSPAGRDTVRICTFDSASMRNAFVPIPVVPVMIDCLFCYVLLLFFTNFLGRDKSLSFLFLAASHCKLLFFLFYQASTGLIWPFTCDVCCGCECWCSSFLFCSVIKSFWSSKRWL